MSKFLILFFLALATKVKTQSDEPCPCEKTNYEVENKLLNSLLEKLSGDVDEKSKLYYSVYPGLLHQLSCNCEENQRKKRKIFPDQPTEVISEQVNPDPNPETMDKRSVHPLEGKWCPAGHIRFGFSCIDVKDFEDY